ncbi:hypothetical protein [Paraburkholderia sp. GAS32]|uniref:hypothetical protein n=1 Tax=Paraburkholderia sp. GAS32 TaxID=3035129 RepID=UPI003D24EE56
MYQQFSESSPSHLRLMAQLGYAVQEQMGKSQAHASLLHSTLRTAGNTHAASHAPANPQRVIQRSAVSDIDREAERKYGERMTALQRQRAKRGTGRQDAEQLRRMSEARTNGGINDEDDEEMIDGVPVSPCSLSKSLHAGAFSRLRLGLHSFMKAQSSDHTDDFATRYGMPTAHVAHVAGRSAVAKPTIAALSKSIETARQRVQTTLGVSPMRNLNQKMQSIARKLGNEQLAKSISGGNMGGLRSAMPRYTTPQVEAAAGAALAHGAIDAQSAQVIANSLALGGVGAVPRELMAKLRGE